MATRKNSRTSASRNQSAGSDVGREHGEREIARWVPGQTVPGGALIGMVHVGALPGTPGASAGVSIRDLARHAAAEAKVLAQAGFDAVLIENMHDAPYVVGPHQPQIVAGMLAAALAVQEALEPYRRGARTLALGVQVLCCGNREAIAIAHAASGNAHGGNTFVRVENFVFAHVADEGLLPRAEAGELLRYRRQIGATGVAVWADLKKKHAAHAITADVPLRDAVHGAEFFGADAVIITGRATGDPAPLADVRTAKAAAGGMGVAVGSGVTPKTVREVLRVAGAVIVGSALKHDGKWQNDIDPKRAAALVDAARG